MADLDPAAVMVEHRGNEIFCLECDVDWPCEPYRLAEALVDQADDYAQRTRELIEAHQALTVSEAKVERVRAVRHEMGLAAEAWLHVNTTTAERLQRFSDDLATALADHPEQVGK